MYGAIVRFAKACAKTKNKTMKKILAFAFAAATLAACNNSATDTDTTDAAVTTPATTEALTPDTTTTVTTSTSANNAYTPGEGDVTYREKRCRCTAVANGQNRTKMCALITA
jgi:hypothetical protein